MRDWMWLATSSFKAFTIMISDFQLQNGALLLRVGDCCWWYVLFKRKLVWSHSTAGKSWFMRALCTLDAYGTSLRCCAVGPICLEMGLHTSSSRWLSLFPSLSLQLLYTHIRWSGSHKRAAIWTITGCLGGVVHSLLAMLKVFSYCRWLCLRKSYYAFTWRIRHLQQWYLELEIFSFCRVFFPQVYNHSKVYNNLLTLHIWKH